MLVLLSLTTQCRSLLEIWNAVC